MLRITIIATANRTSRLRLEGHIAGDWIAELSAACDRILASGQMLALDLGDVSHIDRPGFDFLANLSQHSVSLEGCSPFQEEQLRRVIAAKTETNFSQP